MYKPDKSKGLGSRRRPATRPLPPLRQAERPSLPTGSAAPCRFRFKGGVIEGRGAGGQAAPHEKVPGIAYETALQGCCKGRALPLSDKYRSACLDSRFRPATRPLRRVKRNSRVPPPENPQAAPLICRLPLKGGVMYEGTAPADRFLPGALCGPQRGACLPVCRPGWSYPVFVDSLWLSPPALSWATAGGRKVFPKIGG